MTALLGCSRWPVARAWASAPSGLAFADVDAPEPLRWVLTLMAVGVSASGVRDALAARGLRGSDWPWRAESAA